ncbi:protein phosphatase 2C domain-containing protein [Pseudoclavibacter endophyticus]|uniref:protein phosphatase 2C domain-containing protein n=1 Tax=Pseudoclavibacter endophyticus TaxID=1778590 RepID=UPI0027E3CA63|nr:protein phosphatase 2C domain-containing protein [Pseudoclavibacter endophyticus]
MSHVGRVRSNNQDSAYVGNHVFMVADGMGGHAGGDVASAIAVKHVAEHERDFPTIDDAEVGLSNLFAEGNRLIADAVDEHTELRGMGTTACAITLVGDSIVMGHIGDSRIYRLHDGEFTQESVDHTFVQRLVDAGRITPEEALVHPRRSVLMRVLGDVETDLEVDTMVAPAVPGDRWLLCSDGLSSYVDDEHIVEVLSRAGQSSRETCDDLVQLALDNGAPDNVTVVVVEVGETPVEDLQPKMVGSAANPLRYTSRRQKRHSQLLPSILHPLRRQPKPEDEEFIPPSDEFLEQLIKEDRQRKRRRQLTWLAAVILLVGAIAGASWLAYEWTQTQYFVAEHEGNVAIYQGVQQNLGPFELHHVVEVTDIPVGTLPTYQQIQVLQTISAPGYDEALAIVERLQNVASG